MSMTPQMYDELQRIRAALGCEGRDSHTDPVAVIEMLRSWEVDASVRADRLEQHLRNVLEIARTWQPDYATKMDRDTLDLAAADVGHKTPNVELTGRPRATVAEANECRGRSG